MLKMVRVLLSAFILLSVVGFGYCWWSFGRPDWLWNDPQTVAISGKRYALTGPFPGSQVECLSERQNIAMTSLEYCRVDPPEASTAVLFWYRGEVYTFNIQDPLQFP